MNWIILCVIAVIIFVLSFVKALRSDEYFYWFVIFALTSGAMVICCAVICLAASIEVQKEIAQFEQQKQYIESHTATNAIEDAALTSKKIELNEWLYSVKWDREKLGNWSLVPDYVMELEAIK